MTWICDWCETENSDLWLDCQECGFPVPEPKPIGQEMEPF